MLTTPNDSGLRRIDVAAKFLDCSRSQIYALFASGDLPRLKLGRSVRVRQSDLDKLAKSGTAAGN